MIQPRDVYHWLGAEALDVILESYEIPPEFCAWPVVEQDQDYE